MVDHPDYPHATPRRTQALTEAALQPTTSWQP
jgi:hypothetical protein